MTQEEKQLLLKDLCARVPYGVICACEKYNGQLKFVCPDGDYCVLQISPYAIETIKPYLRPMSSMTEEERKEYNEYLFHGASIGLMSNTETAYELIDWLNARHFDYRCLIEKGLAIEAPEGMEATIVDNKIIVKKKESGDEKIRKELIQYLKECTNLPSGQYCRADFFDWLEKQGESIDREKVLIGARKDVALSIINYLDNNSVGMCLSNMECEDIEDACVNSKWTKLYNYMKKKLEKQGEHNTAWSKDDENRFRNLIYLVEHSDEGKGTKEGFVKFINRLKFIKERHTWKPSDGQMGH